MFLVDREEIHTTSTSTIQVGGKISVMKHLCAFPNPLDGERPQNGDGFTVWLPKENLFCYYETHWQCDNKALDNMQKNTQNKKHDRHM